MGRFCSTVGRDQKKKTFFCQKTRRKTSLGRTRHRGARNIKMHLNEIVCELSGWIHGSGQEPVINSC
jgi:hypothetical protein